MSRISFYIAKRYFLSKNNTQTVNIISWIAVLALVVGNMALSIFLSIFSGLQAFNENIYKKISPDIKIEPKNGKYFYSVPFIINKVRNIKGIINLSQTIEEKVYLLYRNYNHLAYLKGVDLDYNKVLPFNENLLLGNHDSLYFINSIWAGLGVSQRLSLMLEDYENPIYILSLKPGKGLINRNSFYKKQAITTGIFHILEDIDEKYIYSSLEFAQDLFDKRGFICSIEIKVNPQYSLNRIKKDLYKIIGDQFTIKTRQEQQEAIFKMINIENLILYSLLCMILIITSFSLIAAIIILIIDKKEQIRTLWDMGMSLYEIRNVFFYVGSFIVLSGWLFGTFIGYSLALGQKKFNWIMINEYIAFPIVFTTKNFIFISLTVWIIGLMATYCALKLGISKRYFYRYLKS